MDRVLVGKKVDDVEGVLDNSVGHQLFTVVATVHHQRTRKPLSNRALSLSEALGLVSTGSMWHINGHLWLHSDIVLKGHVIDLVFVFPKQKERKKEKEVQVSSSYEKIDGNESIGNEVGRKHISKEGKVFHSSFFKRNPALALA